MVRYCTCGHTEEMHDAVTRELCWMCGCREFSPATHSQRPYGVRALDALGVGLDLVVGAVTVMAYAVLARWPRRWRS